MVRWWYNNNHMETSSWWLKLIVWSESTRWDPPQINLAESAFILLNILFFFILKGRQRNERRRPWSMKGKGFRGPWNSFDSLLFFILSVIFLFCWICTTTPLYSVNSFFLFSLLFFFFLSSFYYLYATLKCSSSCSSFSSLLYFFVVSQSEWGRKNEKRKRETKMLFLRYRREKEGHWIYRKFAASGDLPTQKTKI